MTKKEKRYIILYLVVWVVSVALGFVAPNVAMFFFLEISILLPVMSFALSWSAGRHGLWGNVRWFLPLIFGVMFWLGILACVGSFRWFPDGTLELVLYDMRSYLPQTLLGAIPSALGLAIGTFLAKRKT